MPATGFLAPNGVVQFRSTVGSEAVFLNRLLDACGSESTEWVTALTSQIARVGEDTPEGPTRAIRVGLNFLNGAAPADELEAALAAQMFATHNLAMAAASRASSGEAGAVEKTAELATLFTAQVAALDTLRSRSRACACDVSRNSLSRDRAGSAKASSSGST